MLKVGARFKDVELHASYATRPNFPAPLPPYYSPYQYPYPSSRPASAPPSPPSSSSRPSSLPSSPIYPLPPAYHIISPQGSHTGSLLYSADQPIYGARGRQNVDPPIQRPTRRRSQGHPRIPLYQQRLESPARRRHQQQRQQPLREQVQRQQPQRQQPQRQQPQRQQSQREQQQREQRQQPQRQQPKRQSTRHSSQLARQPSPAPTFVPAPTYDPAPATAPTPAPVPEQTLTAAEREAKFADVARWLDVQEDPEPDLIPINSVKRWSIASTLNSVVDDNLSAEGLTGCLKGTKLAKLLKGLPITDEPIDLPSEGWSLLDMEDAINSATASEIYKHLTTAPMVAHPWPDWRIDDLANVKVAYLLVAGFIPLATIPEYDPGAIRWNLQECRMSGTIKPIQKKLLRYNLELKLYQSAISQNEEQIRSSKENDDPSGERERFNTLFNLLRGRDPRSLNHSVSRPDEPILWAICSAARSFEHLVGWLPKHAMAQNLLAANAATRPTESDAFCTLFN
ncbi:Oidioi.mRNA.OKI2018_I69.YSR.g17143.t1.cds [Oikopleura dioica]|uniref:Oidioi.mRNA.OKI2018_I69.YSR.g17143.t1.cds n=1 Tax=Oikopleura dioica TaxID=34765 RepID=A0ABN7SMX5_OIKDI|nr:Oidioi.mRNA.OKI2018_I69.YSR.g17143.t1.cds [Oikopleura dioica]